MITEDNYLNDKAVELRTEFDKQHSDNDILSRFQDEHGIKISNVNMDDYEEDYLEFKDDMYNDWLQERLR